MRKIEWLVRLITTSLDCLYALGFLCLLALLAPAQRTNVMMGKPKEAIPKECVGLSRVLLDGPLEKIDVPALIKEAMCMGAGTSLSDYTYVMTTARRSRDGKRRDELEAKEYEVYIPTLKGGTRARGILLEISKNSVPTPPDKLEKERMRVGRDLEKAEEKIARQPDAPPLAPGDAPAGLRPVGSYTSFSSNRGFRGGGVLLSVFMFLMRGEFTMLRREEDKGRDTLVLGYRPRAGLLLPDKEKYLTQLTGEIRIDAQDRIVTQLTAWPAGEKPDATRPPAIRQDMIMLTEDGVWLPQAIRINGVDYPELFFRLRDDTTMTWREYKLFVTETTDVKMAKPARP
ncbi:MAG: hypothetical protein ACKV2V_29400 [Blastocatellia bacterium]